MALAIIEAPFAPPRGVIGSRGRGLSYERKVGTWLRLQAAALGWVLHDHPWLEGPCQPDFVLESPSGAKVIVEAKLTETDCTAQAAKYRRVLGEVPFVQICRRLTSPPTIRCLEDLSAPSGQSIDTMLLWL